MPDISVLIGGKAGSGIDTSSILIGRILSELGYRIYIYRDYPSVIRGGHTFSIIRGAKDFVSTHHDNIDYLLALNQETFDSHAGRLKKSSFVIYDSDAVKIGKIPDNIKSFAVPLGKIIKELNASEIMRNICIVAIFSRLASIHWSLVDNVLRRNILKEIDLNLKVALVGYDYVAESFVLQSANQKVLPVITGNEALVLGLIRGGLDTYIAYPMTPSSGILHLLASVAEEFSLKVIHPESEIAVMLMAAGASYTGEKVAVGTSGGGFCLMTDGLSLSGMAELPVTIVLGQRTGPSTGLPTYTGQTELFFSLYAGHGEFCRIVAAPGDAQEAYFWAAVCLNAAYKYQIPAIILTDKTLAEGSFSFDIDKIEDIKEERFVFWDRKGSYKRYLNTDTGVSALACVPDKDAVVKVNSYEHDEYGVTTEDAAVTARMQEKRLRKENYLIESLRKYKEVNVHGNLASDIVIVCWGSNKGVCFEAADILGLKAIQPVVLQPFPLKQFKEALGNPKKIICVENNFTGQLAVLLSQYGMQIDKKILKYDGRPFSLDELLERIKKELL